MNLARCMLALGLTGVAVAAQADATAEIEALKQQVSSQQAQLDALTAAMEGGSGNLPDWVANTSFGGYAELHYNNIDSENTDKDKVQMDLHRFVLFFGHRFSDRVRFFSELEVEHTVAGEGKNGEVELEQAFIEWDYLQNHSAKAGVFLVPVGILNQTHEPDTFYGVERNNVEKNIIPTTWWEGGVMGSGEVMQGLRYDLAVSSGLAFTNGKYKIRDGRQKASEADATDLAYTAAFTYNGLAGISLGLSLQYQTDLLQGEVVNGVADLDSQLVEVHADIQQGSIGLRALYASWAINDDIDDLSDGASEQTGWYLEPSYKITEKLGLFARYSQWDNQAGSSVDSEFEQMDAGVNYWLVDTVALKADVQKTNEPGNTQKGFNLGIGWSF